MNGKQSKHKLKIKTENELLTTISTNNIMELNRLIFAGAKLVSDKIGVPLKNTNKYKTWMGN